MKTRLLLTVPALLLAACAVTDREPIVMMQGVSISQYEADREECQNYADQVDVEQELALGAVIGALSLAAIGAILADGEVIEQAIAVGAMAGTAEGAGSAIAQRNRVLGNCIEAKGYTLLN
jgi:uncharacterized protein YcfJ